MSSSNFVLLEDGASFQTYYNSPSCAVARSAAASASSASSGKPSSIAIGKSLGWREFSVVVSACGVGATWTIGPPSAVGPPSARHSALRSSSRSNAALRRLPRRARIRRMRGGSASRCEAGQATFEDRLLRPRASRRCEPRPDHAACRNEDELRDVRLLRLALLEPADLPSAATNSK